MNNDPDRHKNAVLSVINSAKLLYAMVPDLADIIAEAKRADELGPYRDPTAWMAKGEHLREDIDLLRLALPLVKYAEAAYARIEAKAASEGAGEV